MQAASFPPCNVCISSITKRSVWHCCQPPGIQWPPTESSVCASCSHLCASVSPAHYNLGFSDLLHPADSKDVRMTCECTRTSYRVYDLGLCVYAIEHGYRRHAYVRRVRVHLDQHKNAPASGSARGRKDLKKPVSSYASCWAWTCCWAPTMMDYWSRQGNAQAEA